MGSKRDHHHSSRRRLALAVALTLAASGLVGAMGSPPVAAAPAPTSTPARVGKPTSMAALGDSITQATGTGALSQENPKNSWATGWEVNSVRARLGISTADARNLSANGARMGHADEQVINGRDGVSLAATTQYVTIALGGNDLCQDSVAEMTSTAAYQSQLREALAAIKARAPGALVYVMSVPDIYNLWYIRGAPQHPTLHPEPESSQAAGYNGARFYWGQSFFPCKSLLSNPDSWAPADQARRGAVRQRTIDYNAALRAECGQWLRCRYDGDWLFNLTSNRATPPNGPLKPVNQRPFTDLDISRNEGFWAFSCPVQGLTAGGCGDHFHPSKAGQDKVADAAVLSSYQWADATAPTTALTASPAPRPDGTFRGPVTVTFGGADASGVRGQEIRIHRPDGSVGPWSEAIGLHPAVTVSELGTSYVEARTLDLNGNLSASKILPVNVEHAAPGAPGRPDVSARDAGLASTWTPPDDDGGSAVTGYDVEVATPGSAPSVTRVGPSGAADVAARNGRVHELRVRAVNAVAPGAWSEGSDPALPPFTGPAAYVARIYQDLLGRAPTSAELTDGVAQITTGGVRPADLASVLMSSPAWSGTLSPVIRLYRASFLRLPDASGLAYWEDRARTGTTHRNMSDFFTQSKEFKGRYGTLSNREFVRQVYQNIFARDPEASGWDFWTNELDSGRWSRGRVMAYYSESAEYQGRTTNLVLPVVGYWGALDRVPTRAEQDIAVAALDGGGLLGDLVDGIYDRPEWAAHVT